MPEHTPGYVAALAAALQQANTAALYAAEHGDNQLGTAVKRHPGLRVWNGNLLRLGHVPLTPFAVECNALLPDGLHVDKASHEHVHREHLAPPPGYRDDPTILQWVHCAPDADADGAVPITIAVPQNSTREYTPGVRAAAKRRGITPAEYIAIRAAGFKWCRSCQEWRPLTDYKPSTSTADGVRPLCTRHYKPRQPVPIPHGRLVGYSRGCRCTECRKANTQSQARRKAERCADPTAADRAGHGKASTYINYACRCAPCKEAGSRSNKYYAQRRKQRREGVSP